MALTLTGIGLLILGILTGPMKDHLESSAGQIMSGAVAGIGIAIIIIGLVE